MSPWTLPCWACWGTTTTGVSRQQQLTHVYGLSWWRPGLHGRRRLLPGGRLLTVLEVALDAEPEPAPLSRFGCVCRLAQWPALRGVLGTRSVLIVMAAQVVWCSAACVCVGTTGPVGVAACQAEPVRRLQWTGCVKLVTLY
jgi:hypothetical protein